jgi:hypothetical protein
VNGIAGSLAILAYQYLSLVVCILLVNPRIRRVNDGVLSESIFKKIIYYSGFIIAVNFLYAICFWQYGVGTESHVSAILQTIFTPPNAVMTLILSSMLVDKKTLDKYRFSILFCCALVCVCIVYQGSKSILLQIVLIAYMAALTASGPFVFRPRTLLLTAGIGLAALPLFFLGSSVRSYQRGQLAANGIFMASFHTGSGSSALLNGFSSRIGYLDYFIEKVSNPVYRPVVRFDYYFMSVTDRVLTPGFDIFYVPFMSRALYDVEFGESTTGTNSEQITLFAESHLLLGYFSFIMNVFILFLIKRSLRGYRSSSVFARNLYCLYIVSVFYDWVVGFGLDMLIAQSIYRGIFIFFTLWLVRSKVVVSPRSESVGAMRAI